MSGPFLEGKKKEGKKVLDDVRAQGPPLAIKSRGSSTRFHTKIIFIALPTCVPPSLRATRERERERETLGTGSRYAGQSNCLATWNLLLDGEREIIKSSHSNLFRIFFFFFANDLEFSYNYSRNLIIVDYSIVNQLSIDFKERKDKETWRRADGTIIDCYWRGCRSIARTGLRHRYSFLFTSFRLPSRRSLRNGDGCVARRRDSRPNSNNSNPGLNFPGRKPRR